MRRLAQGHLDTPLGGAGDRTSDPPAPSGPALPPEPPDTHPNPETRAGLCPQPAAFRAVLTLLDDLDEFVGVEAELVRVLRVVGVQRPALGHLGAGLRGRLGPPAARGRPAVGGPMGPGDTRESSRMVGLVSTPTQGSERGAHPLDVSLMMLLLSGMSIIIFVFYSLQCLFFIYLFSF